MIILDYDPGGDMKTTFRKVDKEQVWKLRHKVMWSNKPFDYIKLEDDDLGIHFGLFKEKRADCCHIPFYNQ